MPVPELHRNAESIDPTAHPFPRGGMARILSCLDELVASTEHDAQAETHASICEARQPLLSRIRQHFRSRAA